MSLKDLLILLFLQVLNRYDGWQTRGKMERADADLQTRLTPQATPTVLFEITLQK